MINFFIQLFIYYFIGINIFSFLTMAYDKLKAKFRRYRITERFLIGLALAGGSFGTLAGMIVFRHKIRKKKFFIGVPFIIILQVTIYFYIASFLDKLLKWFIKYRYVTKIFCFYGVWGKIQCHQLKTFQE